MESASRPRRTGGPSRVPSSAHRDREPGEATVGERVPDGADAPLEVGGTLASGQRSGRRVDVERVG